MCLGPRVALIVVLIHEIDILHRNIRLDNKYKTTFIDFPVKTGSNRMSGITVVFLVYKIEK